MTASWMIRVWGLNSQWGLGILLFSIASRPALGPTQLLLSLSVKQPGHETDYSPTSSAEVKNACTIPPPPNTFSWHGA